MPLLNYMVNKLSIVDSLPLFSNLSFFQKNFIVSKSQIHEFKKGDIIYNKGDAPDYFYCIVSGRVEIYHPPDRAGKRRQRRIELATRGDYFGSISSLTGQPHTVSVMALNDSVMLRISTKNFNYILRKIPRLAVFLNHSLSRRLSQKRYKDIFYSTIIGIYGPGSSSYTSDLADNLRRESGKKVFIVKSASVSDKKIVASELSSYAENYHYVLIDVSGRLNDVNLEVLKQADVCHILSLSDKDSLRKTSSLLKILETSFSRQIKQDVLVLLRDDSFYAQVSYEAKSKILSKDIFATLPRGEEEYKKTLRRIARGISGVMIGLALSGGAAMGLAHIGVLKVLEKEKIPIDVISASSMGALVAALWAAGHTAAEIEKFAFTFKSKLKTFLLFDPRLPVRGLIKGMAVRKVLKSYLENKTFFDIRMPLKIVACDIKNRRELIIDKGRLVDAVMASIAIPGVFEPVEYDGLQLIDGGIVNPVPVSVLSGLGIKRIIAVNTLPSPEDAVWARRKKFTILDVIVSSFQEMEYAIGLNSSRQADVYLHPVPKLASWYEFYRAKLFIKTGEEHTMRMLTKIKELVK